MKTDPQLIEIDDTERQDDRPVEVPKISVESTSAPDMVAGERGKAGTATWLWPGVCAVVLVLLACGIFLWALRHASKPEIAASVSDEQNIEMLSEPYEPSARGTTVTSDSVFGVAFDMYSLDGLKASLEREIPDTTDATVVLFMRTADYHPDGTMIGTVVVDGERIKAKERQSRPAYVAISKDGNIAIGISLSDKMPDYAASTGGSFFRQYLLLADGELPAKFQLHGKVERAAIGRMADGELHYVVTRHKETMYDFADALREYGFVDAVYMTGGNAYDFHRTSDGTAHVSQAVRDKMEKYRDKAIPSPMLVFRSK